jgi:hypothetical protein
VMLRIWFWTVDFVFGCTSTATNNGASAVVLRIVRYLYFFFATITMAYCLGGLAVQTGLVHSSPFFRQDFFLWLVALDLTLALLGFAHFILLNRVRAPHPPDAETFPPNASAHP